MKRKLLYINIPFCIAFFVLSQFSIEASLFISVSFAIAFAIYAILNKIPIKWIIVTVVSFAIGIACISSYNKIYTYSQQEYSKGIVSFEGKVSDAKIRPAGKASYEFKGKFEDSIFPLKCTVYTDDLGLEYGDKINMNAEFQIPQNKYYFSTADYYKGKNVILSVKKIDYLEYSRNKPIFIKLHNILNDYRSRITSSFLRAYGKDDGSIASAMLLGEKENLDEVDKEAFYNAGIGHVMAVSGLHIVFILWIVDLFLKKFGIRREFRFITYILVIFLFAICVNKPVSLIRAGLCFIFIKLGILFFRQSDALNSFFIINTFMLIIAPYLIYNVSFMLSVSGTYGVMVLAPCFEIKNQSSKISLSLLNDFISAFCAMISVLPFSIKYFRGVSLLSPISNVFVIPLCMMVLFFSLIVFICGGNVLVLKLCSIFQIPLIKFIRYICRFSARLSLSKFSFGSEDAQIFLMVLILFSFIVYFLFLKKSIAVLSLITGLSLITVTAQIENYKFSRNFNITMLENRSSSLAVISYENNIFAIDFRGGVNSASMLDSYLEKHGEKSISSLIILKKVPSQIVNYENSMAFEKVNSVIISNENYEWVNKENKSFIDSDPVYSDGKLYFGSSDYSIYLNFENDDIYTIITAHGVKFCITKNGEVISDSCLGIAYKSKKERCYNINVNSNGKMTFREESGF